MRKKLFFPVIALAFALSLVGLASTQDTKLSGQLIDEHCAASGKDPHDKGCIVVESCAKTGLGIYADGKFHKFDRAGSDKALVALKASKKDKGATFTVTGTEKDGVFAVNSITENH